MFCRFWRQPGSLQAKSNKNRLSLKQNEKEQNIICKHSKYSFSKLSSDPLEKIGDLGDAKLNVSMNFVDFVNFNEDNKSSINSFTGILRIYNSGMIR